jgi:imidazolonepropionase-like amidohydrolase
LAAAIAAAMASIGTTALLAVAQPPAPAPDTLIHAGRVLADPASGRVLTQQSILVRNGRIFSVTAGYATPQNGAVIIDLKTSFVLPGLIDSHVHPTDEQGPDSRLDAFLKTSADYAIDGAGYALKTLRAGFTTVADLGGDAEAVLALRNGVAAGTIPGPRIVASAGAISVHGGHGDANGMPRELSLLLRGPGVCSGADDCVRAVRERVRDGADIIR